MAQNHRSYSDTRLSSRRHFVQPRLETLEDRCTPAITITGGSAAWLSAGPFAVNGISQVTVANATTSEVTGAIEAVAPHPTNPNILFVGGVNGGVWRTMNALDANPNWVPLTDQLPSLSIGAISINPNNPNQLFVGVGGYSSGVGVAGDLVGGYLTNDALSPSPTFTVIGGPLQQQAFRSVVARDGYLLAGSTGGIFGNGLLGNFGNPGSLFRSIDNGVTFTDLAGMGNLPAFAPINDIVVDPVEAQRVYIATDSQIFRTDNILAPVPVWTNITTTALGINATTSRIRLALHRSAAGEALYVGVANEGAFFSSTLANVSFSLNRGATYSSLGVPETLSQAITITNATNASPIAITTATQHGLGTGDKVVVTGVNGNTAANGTFIVTATSFTTFTLNGSTGNGAYTSGGTAQSVIGIHPGTQANLHFSFAADPVNPNIVYIGGDRQDGLGPNANSSGALDFSGVIFRGNRTIAPSSTSPSPQWTPLTNSFANGTFTHADSRNLAVDAAGTLLQVDDGGVYRRTNPTGGGAWLSLNGNISLNQYNTVRYDIKNNVLFGGTQDTGSSQQVNGSGLIGSGQWENVLPGDGFEQEVDNISNPNVTYRYQTGNFLGTMRRFGYDKTNSKVSSGPVRFADPATPGTIYSALTAGERFAFGNNYFAINAVDGNLMMVGPNNSSNLYEDANPAGLAGDEVTKITPATMKGSVRSLVYGGRAGGVDIPRIAYVGTDFGELFLRGDTGGFNALTVPGKSGIISIAVDPDDWRSVYVLRQTPGEFGGNQIFFSDNAGVTWTDLTENLIGTTLNPDGTVADGLTTIVTSLQLFDPNPGTTDGEELLIAGGRGGVFRRVPSLQKPGDLGPWSEYGVGLPNTYVQDIRLYNNDRLVAATYGRGAWVLPDVADNINKDRIVTVIGDDTANRMTMTPDAAIPGNVIVTDGLGNSMSFAVAGVFSIQFLGLGGADEIVFTANGQAGGDFTQFTFPNIVVDAGGDVGDIFNMNDFNRSATVQVTVTDTTVGTGTGDNLFGVTTGSGVTYKGLQQGTLIVDLSPTAVGGHVFKATASSAASTILLGSDGNDSYTLGGATGLDALNNVTIDARGGASDSLVIDDRLSALGNPNVAITNNSISAMTGPTNAGTINFVGIDGLAITGADNSAFESYTIDGLGVPLTLSTLAGADTVNVVNALNSLTIDTGANNDFIRIAGNLPAIVGKITIEGGSGDNKLLIDNSLSPTGATYVLTSNSIIGATPTPISYAATNGRFFHPQGEGLLIRGSNTGNDIFAVASVAPDSQTVLDGAGGNDIFSIDVKTLSGTLELRGGTGNDIFGIDLGLIGTGLSSFFIDGGEGTDTINFLSGARDDNMVINFADGRSGNTSGVGSPIRFTSAEGVNYDGSGGRNTLQIIDSTTGPANSIVYQPRTLSSGEVRFNGAMINSSVGFNNINGKDSNGLLVFGSATGSKASRDTITVMGISETGQGGTTAANGADTITVSDSMVTIQNSSLGFLRTIAFGQVGGQPTFGAIYVMGGDETGTGDTITVTPSTTVPIFVFGGAPTSGTKGDTLIINSPQPRRLDTAVNIFGNRQSIFRFDDGSIVGFQGFESSQGSDGGSGISTIYAVGADIGGGPRVRVYNSRTGEVIFDQFVYAPSFTGGVRVATGDVTGDGIPDLIVGAGVGGGPHIQIFDGVTFQVIASFFAYEDTFRGGVYVSTADINGDGKLDILVGSGDGGGPLVRAFDAQGNMLVNFFAYDSSFRGGVRVSASDMNGDGIAEIITGAGIGGSPLVRVFNAKTGEMIFQYFSGEENSRNGIFVAAGDLDGDGAGEIVTGPGSNSASEIMVRRSNNGDIVRIGVFDIGPIASPEPLAPVPAITLSAVASQQPITEVGGIRVSVGNFDSSSSRPQILTARGIGYPSRVHAYSLDPMAEVGNFVAFEPSFKGGIFVG